MASGDDRERFWRRVTWESSLATFFRVFSTFDKLCVAVSLWNHQKWIPREISHRYRSIEITKHFFNEKSLKIMQNTRCRPSEPRHPLTNYNRKFYSNFCRILREKLIFSVQKYRRWVKISKIATILLYNTVRWIGSPIFMSFGQRNRYAIPLRLPPPQKISTSKKKKKKKRFIFF